VGSIDWIFGNKETCLSPRSPVTRNGLTLPALTRPRTRWATRRGTTNFVINTRGTVVTPEMVLAQVERYNQKNPVGHLYGAIVASVKDYIEAKKRAVTPSTISAYCAHYIGDLSQPLHSILYSDYNKKKHTKTDGVINDGILDNLEAIKVYPIEIKTEEDLSKEIARIANISMTLGYKLESEGRLLSREEAYQQIGNSGSLMKAVLGYVHSKVN
jgi:hypothetical protein